MMLETEAQLSCTSLKFLQRLQCSLRVFCAVCYAGLSSRVETDKAVPLQPAPDEGVVRGDAMVALVQGPLTLVHHGPAWGKGKSCYQA